ncbi:MAG TPA: cytochrome c3 family protein [Candidatus Binatia bacterium]
MRAATVAALVALCGPALAQTTEDIRNTPHNLSVSGTGQIRAASESRICIFCHTPHNSTPLTPLWNKELPGQVYTVYTSPTLHAAPLPQPFGPTKLCLSCHDGTIAMGSVVNPSTGITMAGADIFAPDSLSNFGLDLSAHHPVSFSYQAALPNPELVEQPPPGLVFGGSDEVHCTTCHDPHNNQFGDFLLKDNRYSALCTTCHQIQGWPGSAHATSPASVVGILPRPPKTWPNYPTLAEWGCETCHTPHFAPTPAGLLNFTDLPPAPFSCTTSGCHSTDPSGPAHLVARTAAGARGVSARASVSGGIDIAAAIGKPSAHHEVPGELERRAATRSGRGGDPGSVTCTDCHNPHLVAGQGAVSAGDDPTVAGGALRGVSGVDRNGITVSSVRYSYEVCLKCHGDNSPALLRTPRVVPGINLRRVFDPSNASFHPVFALGRDPDVPSIPSSFEPSMTATSMITCTSCHADDDGATRGPHGSMWKPILRERYETADMTVESSENYALCYRCHDRQSILSDRSFRPGAARNGHARGAGHRGHLEAGAPCSACHDAHGIESTGSPLAGATGSHTHLINFDTSIVAPKPGAAAPVFTDKGTFAGSCDLVCHGVVHDGAAYP